MTDTDAAARGLARSMVTLALVILALFGLALLGAWLISPLYPIVLVAPELAVWLQNPAGAAALWIFGGWGLRYAS